MSSPECSRYSWFFGPYNNGLLNSCAKVNPLRWNKNKSLRELVEGLHELEKQGKSVKIHIIDNKYGTTSTFNSPEEAIGMILLVSGGSW